MIIYSVRYRLYRRTLVDFRVCSYVDKIVKSKSSSAEIADV